MAKTTEDYFSDWEAHVFGFGYGTGEPHTIGALKSFLDAIPGKGTYAYCDLESKLGQVVVWLLINTLCHADLIEYGTSPRYGWLTTKGARLKEFVGSRSAEELEAMTDRDEHYDHCYPDACNCGPGGYEKGRVCQNPFWLDKLS